MAETTGSASEASIARPGPPFGRLRELGPGNALNPSTTNLSVFRLGWRASIRLAQVNKCRGERVVGKECGTEAHNGKQAHVVEGTHRTEDEHEEHCAKDEGGQYSVDKRVGTRIGLTFFTLTKLNRLN